MLTTPYLYQGSRPLVRPWQQQPRQAVTEVSTVASRLLTKHSHAIHEPQVVQMNGTFFTSSPTLDNALNVLERATEPWTQYT